MARNSTMKRRQLINWYVNQFLLATYSKFVFSNYSSSMITIPMSVSADCLAPEHLAVSRVTRNSFFCQADVRNVRTQAYVTRYK